MDQLQNRNQAQYLSCLCICRVPNDLAGNPARNGAIGFLKNPLLVHTNISGGMFLAANLEVIGSMKEPYDETELGRLYQTKAKITSKDKVTIMWDCGGGDAFVDGMGELLTAFKAGASVLDQSLPIASLSLSLSLSRARSPSDVFFLEPNRCTPSR